MKNKYTRAIAIVEQIKDQAIEIDCDDTNYLQQRTEGGSVIKNINIFPKG